MRYVFAAIFVLHGLIHFIGVANVIKPGSVPQLSRVLIALPDRMQLVGWGLAGLLFLVTGVAFAIGVGPWWTPLAGVAVLVSQAMIVTAWPDAKFGTVANVIALAAVIVAAGLDRFDEQASAVREHVRRDASMKGAAITQAEVDALPPPIARWLTRAGVVGRAPARVVELTQEGDMRTTPDGAWSPVTAEQTFTTEPPAFAWHARVTMTAGLPVRGLDQWRDGVGRMEIRVGGLVPVVNATGAQIDEGSLLRWLGEIVWFPSAALSPAITWAPIDERRAKATLRFGSTESSAEFTIDEQGRFVSMEAQRYLGGGADAKRERWVVPATEWKRFDGIEVPVTGDVTWKLPAGDFTYFRWRILDVRTTRAGDVAPAPSPRSSATDDHARSEFGTPARSG